MPPNANDVEWDTTPEAQELQRLFAALRQQRAHAAPPAMPEPLAIEQTQFARLADSLLQLRDDDRSVLHLHYTQGLAVAEIAELVGQSTATVQTRLRHAFHRLQALLGRPPTNARHRDAIPEAQALERLLAALKPPDDAPAPAAFRAQVLARVEQQQAHRGLVARLTRVWTPTWAPALAAGLLLALTVNGWLGYQALAPREEGEQHVRESARERHDHPAERPTGALPPRLPSQAPTLRTAPADAATAASGLRDLAARYTAQQHYPEAALLLQGALALQEKAFGPDHPGVAASLRDLAVLYTAQGHYAQAEPLLQGALALLEKAFGPDAPSLVPILHDLAALYAAQGQYAQAEPLLSRALALLEEALGPDAPTLAPILEPYAAVLRHLDRQPEAEQLEHRLQTIRALEHRTP